MICLSQTSSVITYLKAQDKTIKLQHIIVDKFTKVTRLKIACELGKRHATFIQMPCASVKIRTKLFKRTAFSQQNFLIKATLRLRFKKIGQLQVTTS